MARTIRARFSHGIIEPLENVEMPESKEITITISETLTKEFIHEEEQRDREWEYYRGNDYFCASYHFLRL